MASNDGVDQLPKLPAAPASPAESLDEKAAVRKSIEKRSSSDSSLGSKLESFKHEDDDTVFVNGEPVIRSGRDVSRYLIDTRDDGDPSLTFRSLFIGTVFAGLGAALCQVRNASIHRCRYPGRYRLRMRTLGLTDLASRAPLDLSFQTRTDVGLHCLPASAYLHGWNRLGQVSSPC